MPSGNVINGVNMIAMCPVQKIVCRCAPESHDFCHYSEELRELQKESRAAIEKQIALNGLESFCTTCGANISEKEHDEFIHTCHQCEWLSR